MSARQALGWFLLSWAWGIASAATETTFEQYRKLSRHLDQRAEVVAFIEANNFLSDRLRRSWLLHLAKTESWEDYLAYYQPSHSLTRRCHHAQALWHTQHYAAANTELDRLWQHPEPLPPTCHGVLNLWLAHHDQPSQPLWQRTKSLLQARHYAAVATWMPQFEPKDRALLRQWIQFSRQPSKITQLTDYNHPQISAMLTDALTRWVHSDRNAAIHHWRHLQTVLQFSHEQKQRFLRKVALYGAMRNQTDAERYFSQLDPNNTPNIYHEWRARAAIKRQDWRTVLTAYERMPEGLQQRPCWQYWRARALEKTGDAAKAAVIYQQLSQQRHYYGFLAGYRSQLPLTMGHQPLITEPARLLPHQALLEQIKAYFQGNKIHLASLLSVELANDLPLTTRYHLAREVSSWGWHDKAIWLANQSQYRDDLKLRFPLAHRTLVTDSGKKRGVKASLIYAIIRQESAFREKVTSSAGALGLMQVIPPTARKVAKRYRIRLNHMKEMHRASKNISIGTAYLKQLIQRFDGHPVLVIAAYNAGPKQVDRWRRGFHYQDSDIWIETLPWYETRNYLKNVIAFDAVYQYRLQQTPSIDRFMRGISSP